MTDYSTIAEYTRHGGTYDRGGADKYYGRMCRPHYYAGETYSSIEFSGVLLTGEQREAYMQGYNDETDKKEWI